MAVIYSSTAIDDRLLGVVTAIDSGGGPGNFILLAGATTVSTIPMANPCGTVSGGVLTFTGPLIDNSADNTGTVNSAVIRNSAGDTIVSGFTVGIPLSSADVIISNGLNSTLINAGQVVQVLAAQITGS
jgi:hypothetical protein